MSFARWFGSSFLVLAGACTRELENAPCPCADGYHCCEALNICYPDGLLCKTDAASGASSGGQTSEASGGGISQGSTESGGASSGGTSSAGSASSTGGSSGPIATGGTPSTSQGGVPSNLGGGEGGMGGEAGGEGGEAGASGAPGLTRDREFAWVATEHNDNARTGANADETSLNGKNVNAAQFGELSRRSLRGAVFAQPLVAPRVRLDDGTSKNIVYVATMANVVFALDAEQPDAAPIWVLDLERPAIGLPDPLISTEESRIWQEIGILGTPVISAAEQALYLVAATKGDDGYAHWIYKLALDSGRVLAGPVRVAAPDFDSARQAQLGALTFDRGMLYVPFGDYARSSLSSGWVFAYDAALAPAGVSHLGTPDGASVTMSGHGPAVDDQGTVYLTTNSGVADSIPDASAFGSSLLALTRSGSELDVTDRFRSSIPGQLTNDELGSTGPLLVPDSDALLLAGQRQIHLLKRTALSNEEQAFRVDGSPFCTTPRICHALAGAPVFWRGSGPEPQPRIYLWAADDPLRAFALDARTGRFECGTAPAGTCNTLVRSKPEQSFKLDGRYPPGAQLSVSSNGVETGTGIVWAAHSDVNDGDRNADGILRAYDAETLDQLWSSREASRPLGPLPPTATVTVSGGRVFVGTAAGISDKQTLFDWPTGHAPALASLHDDFLVMAWVQANEYPGIRLAWSRDGVDFSDSGAYNDELSLFDPAMVGDGGSRLFLAWGGDGQRLKVAVADNPGFSGSIELEEAKDGAAPAAISALTRSAPSLAFGSGKLFLAWQDSASENTIVSSSPDGLVFDSRTTLPAPTLGAPTLAYVNERLYLFQSDSSHRINVRVSSDDGQTFSEAVVLAARSTSRPAFAALDFSSPAVPNCYLFWTDDSDINSLHVASTGQAHFDAFGRDHLIRSDEALGSPAAATFRGALYLAWAGTDSSPNVARYSAGELVTYGLAGR